MSGGLLLKAKPKAEEEFSFQKMSHSYSTPKEKQTSQQRGHIRAVGVQYRRVSCIGNLSSTDVYEWSKPPDAMHETTIARKRNLQRAAEFASRVRSSLKANTLHKTKRNTGASVGLTPPDKEKGRKAENVSVLSSSSPCSSKPRNLTTSEEKPRPRNPNSYRDDQMSISSSRYCSVEKEFSCSPNGIDAQFSPLVEDSKTTNHCKNGGDVEVERNEGTNEDLTITKNLYSVRSVIPLVKDSCTQCDYLPDIGELYSNPSVNDMGASPVYFGKYSSDDNENSSRKFSALQQSFVSNFTPLSPVHRIPEEDVTSCEGSDCYPYSPPNGEMIENISSSRDYRSRTMDILSANSNSKWHVNAEKSKDTMNSNMLSGTTPRQEDESSSIVNLREAGKTQDSGAEISSLLMNSKCESQHEYKSNKEGMDHFGGKERTYFQHTTSAVEMIEEDNNKHRSNDFVINSVNRGLKFSVDTTRGFHSESRRSRCKEKSENRSWLKLPAWWMFLFLCCACMLMATIHSSTGSWQDWKVSFSKDSNFTSVHLSKDYLKSELLENGIDNRENGKVQRQWNWKMHNRDRSGFEHAEKPFENKFRQKEMHLWSQNRPIFLSRFHFRLGSKFKNSIKETFWKIVNFVKNSKEAVSSNRSFPVLLLFVHVFSMHRFHFIQTRKFRGIVRSLMAMTASSASS